MIRPAEPDPGQGITDFYQHWQQLNDWLVKYETFWRPVPFTESEPAWCHQYPELAGWLDHLPDEDCEYLADHPAEFAQGAAVFESGLKQYSELVALPVLALESEAHQATLPETRAVDMPGRKRLQAGAFASAVLPSTGPVLDWCCGKGHLARTLAGQGAGPVLGFEWDPELVADGNRLAERYSDPVRLKDQNVMVGDLQWPAAHQGVALHACGDLHRQLLQVGSAAQASRLSLSPCCYQRTEARNYQPLSQRARARGRSLVLDRSELKLAVQETVTAPARVRRQTARISVWRLGFDALQRHLRGTDDYLPVPSHPTRLNNGDFEQFCRWAAQKKKLDLPAALDWQHWLNQGERRLQQVRRHELLRHLFRRPLELVLVLDYAMFLEEEGYEVRLGTFCERSLTPRNLLLDAVRVAS
jgi:hypothetical protein